MFDTNAQTAKPESARRGWPQIYFGVLATTLATLVFELALTRVFSVVFYYHFAFLAISIALFGLGAGGVLSYVIAGWRWPLFQKLGATATANALVVAASVQFLLTRKGDLSAPELVAVYFACAAPFVLAGIVVSTVIAETIQRVDRIYFFDLIGAATGCAVLVPLLNLIGGPNTALVPAVLFAASGAVWFHLAHATIGRIVAVSAGLCLVALITFNAKYFFIDVHYAKGQPLRNEEFVRWNSFSRVAMKKDPDFNTRSVFIDGDAQTGIAQFDFQRLTQKDRDYLRYHGPGFAYLLRPGAKTLVIGSGGGWDVARAIASGSRDVTAVEINPIIATTIMRKRFPAYSNYLYFRPDVHVMVEDGRAFVRSSPERYQVLQATLVDTWASTAAGAFALSENTLYTTEAFRDYLTHLTDDGLMSFTRWGFQPPRESLRVVSLARAALDELGEPDAASHVMVIREDQEKLSGWGAQDTILVARKPFTPADVDRVRDGLGRGHMQAIYLPGDGAANAFAELLHTSNSASFFAAYPFDVRPVSDNRPFFFYTVQPRDLLAFAVGSSHDSADYKVNRAVPLLFGLLGVSLLAMLIILALPPLVLGHRLPVEHGSFMSLLYFVAIGVGYILVQVALIQKFVLFLGHPTYALTVVIFAMLVSSGLGSFASRRLVAGSFPRLSRVLLVSIAGIALLAIVTGPITRLGVGLPFAAKLAVSVALIAPVGFAMGMPFPSGLAQLEAMMPSAVRWAWAVNSAASVLGSAAGIFVAIYFGLQASLVLGGLLYAGAWAGAATALFGRHYLPVAAGMKVSQQEIN